MSDVIIETNEFQTPITRELLDQYPAEVQEQFMDFVDTVPLIKWMIGTDRPRAKDLPRDEQGRIIVDITHPHILEDMDYFRPAAKFFEENGCYTLLRPNSNPNSEFGKWFTEERRRCREGYVRESDGEWVTGQMYFFLNYCRIMLVRKSKNGVAKRVEDFPDFWEGIYYRSHYIDQARKAGKHCVELARRGAHPYSQKVYTPDGIKQWGDIQIGDRLFGTDGNITTVVDIPFDDVADVYKFTLRDGRVVYASDDHIWNVVRKNGKVVQRTTKELLCNYALQREKNWRIPSGIEYQYFIPSNDGVDYNPQTLPIEPYTMGLLLGDGCFRTVGYKSQVTISGLREDIEHYASRVPYQVYKISSDDRTWAIKLSLDYLYSEGLWMKKSEDKYIPDIYKYGSRDDRMKLLQGLFDTDGYGAVCKRAPQISTSSERLASDIMEVARSLGYNCGCTKEKAGYKKDGVYKQCNDTFIVTVYAGDEVFTLARKKAMIDSNSKESRKRKTCIVDISYVGRERCKCVTVDAPDSSYLIGDFVQTHNCGKSFFLAGMMSHNLILGENEEVKQRVTTVLTAYLKEYLAEKDGTLSKFTPMIDFLAAHTEFPRLMYKRSQAEMTWIMGYKNKNGNIRGSLNSVLGLSVKDDEGKVRGKRGFIFFEEIGSYSNFRGVWDNVRDSVKDGDEVFSLLYGVGTAGDKESDFAQVKTILYNPNSYEVLALENVYDQKKKGTKHFCYFFPSYMSRTGCMDSNGNSDVVKALLSILMMRYDVKHGGDPASLLSRIAQMPITPAEAILKVNSTKFPSVMINERIRQLDIDPHIYDDIYIGDLIETPKGVEFRRTDDIPIRDWPVENTNRGALEIYSMPQKMGDSIPQNRYICGSDPVDNDEAQSESLFCTWVFDLWEDVPVALYLGRKQYAEDNYEMARLLTIFYNATLMYEANRKRMYSHFSFKRCLYLLADCPEYLRAKGYVKYSMFGSGAKGISVNAPINNLAIDLMKDWLLEMVPVETKDEETGEMKVISVARLYTLRCRELLKEMVSYGPEVNTDSISSFAQVMLYREHFRILYGGKPTPETEPEVDEDDEFFKRDWNKLMGRLGDSYHSTLPD